MAFFEFIISPFLDSFYWLSLGLHSSFKLLLMLKHLVTQLPLMILKEFSDVYYIHVLPCKLPADQL
jgi:hypothetical protein